MSYLNSLEGTVSDETRNTFLLPNTVTQDDIGKAVTIDTSADNAAKLAGDGDAILGRLANVEIEGSGSNKVVHGMVENLGGFNLPVATGVTLARGASVVGALDTVDTSNGGAGYVKAGASPDVRFCVVSTAKQTSERTVTVYRT